MEWEDELFVGKKAKDKIEAILEAAYNMSVYSDAFIIITKDNSLNIQIISLNELSNNSFLYNDFKAIGVAKGYEEARELLAMILTKRYKKDIKKD